MNQEQVWNNIAKQWNEFRATSVDEVKDFLKNKKGKILDLGCGSGRNFIKNKNLEFYGTDFSEKLLKFAKSKNIATELKKSTTNKIPYQDNFFDHIIFVRVLHCIETENKRKKTLQEIYRTLKKNGEAVISTMGKSQQRIKNKPKEFYLPWTIKDKKFKRYTYIYDKDELENQLKETGFKIISIKEGDNIVAVVKKFIS
jgi:ubiquinone/menaquinone biosynthesis C-methylase UbiE